MSYELKKLAEDLKRTWDNELKPRIESGERHSAEAKQAVSRVQDRLDDLEAMLQRASLAPARSSPRRDSAEAKSFETWLRHGVVDDSSSLRMVKRGEMSGIHSLPPELKALALRDESLGGVLAPADYVAEVIKGVVQFSPLRQVAKVRPTKRTSVQAPKRTGNLSAQWTSETGTRAETTGSAWGLEEIPTHEAYARVVVSNWDLEDSAIDLAADLEEAMAEQFGVAEGTAFITGNGIGKPEGFATHADVEVINNGATTFTDAIGANGLISAFFALKDAYWANATWALNRLTLRDIRLLRDDNKRYIWTPAVPGGMGVAEGMPPTILDRPYIICPDMPVVASNALAVAVGDFKRGYWIADRIDIQTLRDPYTAATTGQVIFHARKRVGGQVVVPEAIKLLKMAA